MVYFSSRKWTLFQLLYTDVNFIRGKQLRPEDVAGYTNGYYSVFADLDIYKAFDSKQVKDRASFILCNAIMGKIGSINRFSPLYHIPGNFPKFVSEYDIDVDLTTLYNSFMKFLEISLLIPQKSTSSENI